MSSTWNWLILFWRWREFQRDQTKFSKHFKNKLQINVFFRLMKRHFTEELQLNVQQGSVSIKGRWKKKDQKEKSLFRYDKFQNGKRSTALLIKRRKIKKWGDVLNGRNEDYLSFIRWHNFYIASIYETWVKNC